MKTPEEIVREVRKKLCCVLGDPEEQEHDMLVIRAAINEAIEQERNRTCEWAIIEVDDYCWDYVTACGKGGQLESPYTDPDFPLCGSCGGKIELRKQGEKK